MVKHEPRDQGKTTDHTPTKEDAEPIKRIERIEPTPYEMTQEDAIVGRRPEYTGVIMPQGSSHPALALDSFLTRDKMSMLASLSNQNLNDAIGRTLQIYSEGSQSLIDALRAYGSSFHARDILLSNMLLLVRQREDSFASNAATKSVVDSGIFYSILASYLLSYLIFPADTWNDFKKWAKNNYQFDVVGIPTT